MQGIQFSNLVMLSLVFTFVIDILASLEHSLDSYS